MFNYNTRLPFDELQRYSSHMALPEVSGPDGQLKIKNTRVTVVGAGGLGNITCSYLAAAGFGRIVIVDFDKVELKNLNRQILYSSKQVGLYKAVELKERLTELNPTIDIEAIIEKINFKNSSDLLKGSDIVVDCTDNPSSRYCINDACVDLGVPLVFGSSLRWEGQLTVYGYNDGPCLRCVFPSPPPPELLGTCEDQGVVGPIVGVIGSMQALETIKVALGLEGVMSGRVLLFDALKFQTRVIRVRTKRESCTTCGVNREKVDNAFDELLCQKVYSNIPSSRTISCVDYRKLLSDTHPHVLIDVRSRESYKCAHFDHSINIPIDVFLKSDLSDILSQVRKKFTNDQVKTVCVICKRGRSSRDAVNHLLSSSHKLGNESAIERVYSVSGGFQEWQSSVDPESPFF